MSGPPPTTAELRPGDIRAGCRVERLLGRGGMGAAYLAVRPDGVPVVLKLLSPGLARDATLRGRFRREWDALRRLQDHPQVVRVLSIEDDDPPCIVLEFVDGASLDRVLAGRRALPVGEALALAAGVARGLAALHAVGIVHRDIKPANLIATRDGGVKIVDLGLAKDLFRTALTQPGQLLGTAHYMAPEQWEDGPIDARTDVYALGATLYHLLTGRSPFEEAGDDMDEIADRALAGSFPAPRALVPAIPPEAELVVLRMLAPRASERYAGAEDCLADLEAVRAGGAARVPCLALEQGGARAPLLRGDLFTLGSDPTCWPATPGPGVAPRHAQVRREERGFVLRDLQSPGGTFVNDQRLAAGQAHVLRHADRVRLGGVPLRFHDPGASASEAAYLRDVERAPAPAPVVDVLGGTADPRATALLLERLALDRADLAAVERALAQALGPDVARAVGAHRREHAPAVAAAASSQLAALAGARLPQEPTAWLSWWYGVRATAPVQLAPPSPPRTGTLSVAGAGDLDLTGRGVVLLGRDPRCQVRLPGPAAPRLAATLLRLHRRWTVVSADGAQARFLEPDEPLELGGTRVLLRAQAAPARDASGALLLDPGDFAALEALRHPSTGGALVALLALAARAATSAEVIARALYPDRPAAARSFAGHLVEEWQERARRARLTLTALAGRDAGAEPAAWQALLGSRLAGVPAVAPLGWLE